MSAQDGYLAFKTDMIPKDWFVSTIAELGSIRKGKGINRDSVLDLGEPCVRYGEIYTLYNYSVKKVKSFISSETAQLSEKIEKGEMLFTGSGETAEDIGKAVVYLLEEPGYAGGDLLILRPNPKIIDPLFLSFQWETESIRTQRRQAGQGASIFHLYPDALKKMLVLVPPIQEQYKIADILSTVDDHISETEALIDKTQVLKKGLMQRLLTRGIGHTEFKDTEIGRIPVEWEVKSVGDVAELGRGRVISHKEIAANPGQYPVFSSQTTNNGCMGYLATNDFEGEYVTWTTDGANAGSVFYRFGKFNCTNVCGTMKVTDHTVGTRFASIIVSQFTRQKVVYNGNPKLMNNIMAIVTFPVPPLPEQLKIASILTTIGDNVDIYKSKLTTLTTLKSALMQQLLTGKVRVKV